MLPVVCHCEYKKVARFGEALQVTAEVNEVKGKVISITYTIENIAAGRIITTGLTKQVFCDENGKSFVLEERFPGIYFKLLEN